MYDEQFVHVGVRYGIDLAMWNLDDDLYAVSQKSPCSHKWISNKQVDGDSAVGIRRPVLMSLQSEVNHLFEHVHGYFAFAEP